MTGSSPELSSQGLRTTGLAEVDRRIGDIVAGDQTTLTPDLHSKNVPFLGRDIYFGTSKYKNGEAPFTQEVEIDPEGRVERLTLTQKGERDIPPGFKDKAARLEERDRLFKPPDSFPEVTGWQLTITWGYFNMDSYRSQRAEALYPEAHERGGLAAVREALREDPIVVISPIISTDISAVTTETADEMFAMFARYNRGDLIPASIDFSKYPYMEVRTFEDEAFMKSLVADFMFEESTKIA